VKKETKSGKSGWKPTNLDLSFDFCAFVRGMKVPLIDVFAPGIGELFKTTFPTCPFLNGFHIRNYTVTSRKFPSYNPVGTQLKTDITLKNEKSVVFLTCYLYGSVYSE
jgi:Protein of unknown function (DUF1091)